MALHIGTQTVGHAVHLDLRVAIMDQADGAAGGAGVFQLCEEVVEEAVVVSGKPETDVAAVELVAEVL